MDALIEQAIHSRHVLEFTYQGLHRIAEPQVFGYYDGEKQLLASRSAGKAVAVGYRSGAGMTSMESLGSASLIRRSPALVRRSLVFTPIGTPS